MIYQFLEKHIKNLILDKSKSKELYIDDIYNKITKHFEPKYLINVFG